MAIKTTRLLSWTIGVLRREFKADSIVTNNLWVEMGEIESIHLAMFQWWLRGKIQLRKYWWESQKCKAMREDRLKESGKIVVHQWTILCKPMATSKLVAGSEATTDTWLICHGREKWAVELGRAPKFYYPTNSTNCTLTHHLPFNNLQTTHQISTWT